MRHAGREEPEDHVGHAVLANERLEVPARSQVGRADEEAVHRQAVQGIGRGCGVDERVFSRSRRTLCP